MRVIEEIFYGNINPNDKEFTNNKDLKLALDELVKAEKILEDIIDKKHSNILCYYLDAQIRVMEITARENFAYGFKLGTKLGLEIVSEDDSCDGGEKQ